MLIRLTCGLLRTPLLFPLTYPISYKKRLIKRRKIRTKKLPVSHDRLLQLKKVKNVPMLQRQAQIRQRLQHQPNLNRNVNQIIQQLFFPDLRMQDAMSIQSSFKIQQLQAQAQLQNLVSKTQLDHLLHSHLNIQLLQTYQTHKHKFTVQDLCRMVRQMTYNTKNLEEIKKRKLEMWEKYIKKVKDKKPQNPLRFLDEKDVSKHKTWGGFEKDMEERLENCEGKEVDGYLRLAHELGGFLGLIPFYYFDCLMRRLQKEEFNNLSVETKTSILKLICTEWKVKLPQQVRIQQRAAWRQKLSLYGAQLIAHIANTVNPIPAQTIGYIIKAGQIRQQYLKPSLLFQLQPHILKSLSSFTFQQSVDVFLLYHRIKKIRKRQPLPYPTTSTSPPNKLQYSRIKPLTPQTIAFLEFIKFDMLRKLPSYRKFKSVLELIKVINDREVRFGKTPINMGEFSGNLVEAALRQMKQHKVSGVDLLLLLRNYFYNRFQSKDFYEMIAVELARKEQELSLEELFEALFMITIKKVTVSSLKEIAMRRALKQYKNIQNRLIQQRTKYLPTNTQQPSPKPTQTSQKQLHFQNNLILFLWSYLKDTTQQTILDLDGIFSMYPKTILSKHTLIYELCLSIQKTLEKYKMFPKFLLNFPERTSDAFLDRFYMNYSATNRNNMSFKAEMRISGKFINNFNIVDKFFVKEAWSEENCVDMKKYLEWVRTSKPSDLFFGTPVKTPKTADLNSLTKRRQKIKQKIQLSSTKKDSSKPTEQEDSYILTDDKQPEV